MQPSFLAIYVFFISYASLTNAGMVTATYTGTVTSTNTGTVTISEVKVGDTVTGQYVFDDTVADELPLDPVNGRYEASQFSLTVNGFNYSSADNTIAILDNGVPGPGLPAVDLYEVVTSLGNTPGPSLSGLPPSQIDLIVVDTDTTAFSDDSLPTSLNIEDFEITNDQWNKFQAAYGTVAGNAPGAYDESPTWTGASVPRPVSCGARTPIRIFAAQPATTAVSI